MTWDEFLTEERKKVYFQTLIDKLKEEDKKYTIFPIKEDRLNAFKKTPFYEVKVIIIGQDPYHDVGQAHGLSFSIRSGKYPPSLQNIFKELVDDLRITPPKTGDLTPWAEQGVLLLNPVLTVRAHEPLSHQAIGWHLFTMEAIKRLSDLRENLVFILWGNHAKRYIAHIDTHKHHIITSAHPSPLSASRGFFGSKPFSKTNTYLTSKHIKPINWVL